MVGCSLKDHGPANQKAYWFTSLAPWGAAKSAFQLASLQLKLRECEEVLENDYFLAALKDEFVENARLFIFETYCRIHQCIDLRMLAGAPTRGFVCITEACSYPACSALYAEPSASAVPILAEPCTLEAEGFCVFCI